MPPRIINIFINPSKVGEVIGPGGKVIKKIIADTGAKIEVREEGKISIASLDMEAVKKAKKIIEDITAEAEIGKTYDGKVVRIEDYGAFIQILPNVDGLLHISEIAYHRIGNVRDVLKIGQIVQVKVISIDENSKVRLSKKALEQNSHPSFNDDRKRQKKVFFKKNHYKKDRF